MLTQSRGFRLTQPSAAVAYVLSPPSLESLQLDPLSRNLAWSLTRFGAFLAPGRVAVASPATTVRALLQG